ncbi:MAG: tetratricopeptide repeat protein, partial [Pseudomonadota bacterium]
DALAQAKDLVEAGDFANAAGLYSRILQADADNAAAIAGLAKCLVQMGNLEDAKSIYDSAPEDLRASADMASVKAALDLAEAGAKAAGEIGALQQRLQADPNDMGALYDLASALFASGDRETAIDQLLALFSKDQDWNEGAARKQLIKFFEAMGPTDPLTISGRRRLSALLFS